MKRKTLPAAAARRSTDTYKTLLRQETLILDVTEALARRIDEQELTSSAIATRTGRNPRQVSNALNGGNNLTLRALSDIAHALHKTPHFAIGGTRTGWSHQVWTHSPALPDSHPLAA